MKKLATDALQREYLEYLFAPGPKDFYLKAEVWSYDEITKLFTVDDLVPLDTSGQIVPTPGTARSCVVQIDRKADIRRTVSLVIDNSDGSLSQADNDPAGWIFAEGNVLKVWMGYKLPSGSNGEFPVFWGYIGKATVGLDIPTGDSVVNVPAAGLEQKLINSRFADTTKYSDTPTESANYAAAAQGATASATSNVQVSDQIQGGARVYLVQAYATVLGIRKPVTTPKDARTLIDGSTATGYSITYSESGLTKLELVTRLDLRTVENVASITPRLAAGTTATKLRTSQTGYDFAWTNQTATGMTTPASLRYIEFTAEASATAGSATVAVNEIEVVANAAYPASQAIDGDALTGWRPRATDLDRTITISFGQARTFNAIYLQWGNNPVDLDNPVAYKLMNGDTGAVLADQSTSVSGLVEHVILGGVTCSSVKTQVYKAAGLIHLRNVEVLNVIAVNTVTFLLGDMATGAGLTRQRIDNSKLYRANLTARIGEDYIGRMKEIVGAIGWRLFGEVDGYVVAGRVRINPAEPDISYLYPDVNFIGSFSVDAPDLTIKNHVVVLCKRGDLVTVIRG